MKQFYIEADFRTLMGEKRGGGCQFTGDNIVMLLGQIEVIRWLHNLSDANDSTMPVELRIREVKA